MPMIWDATNSMQMLLLVIAEADIKPSTATWSKVASKLGDITPGAVSQKFYKLKKECEQLKTGDGTAGPSTPKAKGNGTVKTPGSGRGRKRKTCGAEGESATKRSKKHAADVAEEEPENDEAQGIKAEDEGDVDEVVD